MTGQVSDPADVLSSTEESQVQSALDDLQSEDGIQLYVVYVDSFDGAQPPPGRTRRSSESTLGNGDVLFAVATEDRRDGYHVGPNTDVTESGLADLVSGDVESQLGSGDWSAAAVTLADGIQSGDASGSGSGSGDGGGGGSPRRAARDRRRGWWGLRAGAQPAPQEADRGGPPRAAEERAAAEAAARDPYHGTTTEQLTFRASERAARPGRGGQDLRDRPGLRPLAVRRAAGRRFPGGAGPVEGRAVPGVHHPAGARRRHPRGRADPAPHAHRAAAADRLRRARLAGQAEAYARLRRAAGVRAAVAGRARPGHRHGPGGRCRRPSGRCRTCGSGTPRPPWCRRRGQRRPRPARGSTWPSRPSPTAGPSWTRGARPGRCRPSGPPRTRWPRAGRCSRRWAGSARS